MVNGFLFIRAVKVNALIYEIIVAEINAIKYFNAVNATLFTSGVRCPLTQNRRVPMSRPRFTDDSDTPTSTLSSSLPFLLHHWPANKPANESLLSHTTPPHWSRTVTCPTPTCSLTLRTSQYLFNIISTTSSLHYPPPPPLKVPLPRGNNEDSHIFNV